MDNVVHSLVSTTATEKTNSSTVQQVMDWSTCAWSGKLSYILMSIINHGLSRIAGFEAFLSHREPGADVSPSHIDPKPGLYRICWLPHPSHRLDMEVMGSVIKEAIIQRVTMRTGHTRSRALLRQLGEHHAEEVVHQIMTWRRKT